ncbi:hypothetical protein [Cognatilysobacter bugurensis]|uniref:Lipoprotein n=1 Tax=Cognatilysobacter bugurensis TaxID=543356 RepID=A0A918T2F9_9GAMM|nr:hypothetical protein [Lysobacter bugurensis]GHA86489.1 hypothetical protein GCM10007067_25680 [Lysobacter bugurensis]
MNVPDGLALTRCPIAALLVAVALSACAVAEEPPIAEHGEPAAARLDLPPLHLVRTIEQRVAGQNPMQESYRQTEARCREAGWPVRPLTSAQMSKLGTQKLELMLDADHRLARTTRWEWVPQDSVLEHLCLFRFVENVDEAYMDRRISGGTSDGMWQEGPTAPEDLDVIAIEDDRASESLRIAAQTGWTEAGVRKAAGQACRVMKSATVEVCMWTAGRAWGMDELPVLMSQTMAADPAPGGLTLEQVPLNGTGERVSTELFTVGKPLSSELLRPTQR